MTKGELKKAERRALNILDEWNSVTWFLVPDTSYFYEFQAVVRDAVHCGVQQATGDFRPLTDGEKSQPWRIGKQKEKGEA